MTGPTHILFGIASIVGCSRILGVTPDRLNFGLTLLGSLLPDIDGNGMICRLAPGLPTISSIIERLFKHRGFFHWLFLPVITGAYGVLFQVDWLSWLSLGYLSHLLADTLTMSGVPAQPLRRRLSAKLLKTGSFAEAIVFIFLLVITVLFGFPLLPPEIQSLCIGHRMESTLSL